MPKLTQRLPQYRKHKASGQAIVKLGGKTRYLGRHGTKASREEYQRVVGEWLSAGRHNPASKANADDLLIVEVLARYMNFAQQHYRKHGRPTNELENIKYALRPLKTLYGRSRVADFGPLGLKALQAHLIEQRLARSTINARIGIIRRMFRWAVSEQLCPPLVIYGLGTVMGLQRGRTRARETPPVLPVADEVVEQTVKHLPPVVHDMVMLQRLLVCRPSEVCSIRPGDLNRDHDVWIYRPQSHKCEHHELPRTVFVGPRAQAILQPYLLRAEDSCCFQPAESEVRRRRRLRKSRHTAATLSEPQRQKRRRNRAPGRSYCVAAYRRAIARACAVAFPPPDELPRDQRSAWRKAHAWHPNQLRHSAGTEIRHRFGVEAARVCLGHSKISTTELYAARDDRLGWEVATQIG